MAAEQQDYLLRQIALLRQIVARLLGRRDDDAGVEEAIQLAQHLHEKLFPLPPAEFLRLDIEDQLAALKANESAAAGREKCLTYAELLTETAQLYALRERHDLALGARQLALYVALRVALDDQTRDARVHELITSLRVALAGQPLHAPTQALLGELESRSQ